MGILPSHLRLALLKYAQDESLLLDPTGKTRIIPRSVMLDCDVEVIETNCSPHGPDAHPDDDATGHNGGVHRTHEDFGPRLPRSDGAPPDLSEPADGDPEGF
jgi:hypothetical protein